MINTVKLPVIRTDLLNLTEKIKCFVYQEGAGFSIAEIIGVLEITKIEIYNDAKGKE